MFLIPLSVQSGCETVWSGIRDNVSKRALAFRDPFTMVISNVLSCSHFAAY